jgi:hypothetical protein
MLRLARRLPEHIAAKSWWLEASSCFLPARLDDAWDFSLERQRPEAQAANAKLAQKTSRPSAELAPIVLAAAELRLPRVFHSLCSSCHNPLQTAAFSF